MRVLVAVAVLLGLAACGPSESADKPPSPEYQSCRCVAPAEMPGGAPFVEAPRLHCWRSDQPGLSESLTAWVNKPVYPSTEVGNTTCTCMEAIGRDCSCGDGGTEPPKLSAGITSTALCQTR